MNFESDSATTNPAPATKSPKPPARRSLKGLIKNFSFLLLIGAVAASLFLYYQTRREVQRLSTPEGQREVSQREVAAVVAGLGKLTLLPDEEPVVATVVDAEYLASQSAFYRDAQNGDKLVVYPQAQKAYIYSPERNIIVNAGPLIINQPPTETLTVEIRNGTTTPGLGTQLRQQIEGNGIEVIAVTDAVRRDYQTSQVINLTGKVPAEQLGIFAQNISATVTNGLPAGEAASTADVLIIVGEPTTAASPSPSPAGE